MSVCRWGFRRARGVLQHANQQNIVAMDGVLKQGADTISYMVEELRDVFWKENQSGEDK